MHLMSMLQRFLSSVQGKLLNIHIFSMATLQDAYTNIRTENNVTNPRKMLKKLLQREIPEIEFHKSNRVNEPESVSIKHERDAAIQFAEDETSILRKVISKATPWTFTCSAYQYKGCGS